MLARLFGEPAIAGKRFSSIDGLRGYLAFGVFLHHAVIWYFFLHTSKWQVPSSHLYTHLGQSSVALFFMITGFLFWSKLIDGRARAIDWRRLYVSRVFRLTPLYLFAILAVLFLVMAASGFNLNEPLRPLLRKTAEWLAFTIPGNPDLNGFRKTFVVIAGVTWSLPYEWLFYAALPLGALVLGTMPPKRWLIFSLVVLSLVAIAMPAIEPIYLATFGGGIAAAFCARSENMRARFSGKVGAILAIVCFGATVIIFPRADNLPSVLLLSMGFIAIACGNTLFGVLALPASRLLGEIGYSLYLLHGILLFATFQFGFGMDAASTISASKYWLLILGIVPVLVTMGYITFRMIESPGINAGSYVHRWLTKRLPTAYTSEYKESV